MMEKQFYSYLEFEEQLLNELVRLAGRQQDALVHYNIKELEEITAYQDELLKSIRLAEEKRISLLSTWFKVTKREASELQLSILLKQVEDEETRINIKALQDKLKGLIEQLQGLNTTNRLLTNKARYSIKEMVSALTGNKPLVSSII